MESDNGIVKVGSKPKRDYINASLFCLENFSEARIRGLGSKQGKVLEIAETLERINGLEITGINCIQIEDTAGLEIGIKRVRGGENERGQR